MLKLSEAIRLGAMLRHQVFGRTFKHGGSCAMGAAIEAVTNSTESDIEVRQLWTWLAHETFYTPCPACHGIGSGFSRYGPLHMIVHLNDQHEWTRERIADWVATVEPRESEWFHECAQELVAV